MGISTDWFIYFTAYFLCVFVRLDTANKAKPKDVCPALCEISLLSDEPALWNLPPLSGLLPNVVLVLVFVLRHLVCMFLFPFLPPLILPCLPASFFFSCIPKFLSFPIISTRIHLWNPPQCLTQFLMPDFFFPVPIRGHANFQRQTTVWIRKYPIRSSNMLIFLLCCSRNGNRMLSKTDCVARVLTSKHFKSVSLCLLTNASLGDMSFFALY